LTIHIEYGIFNQKQSKTEIAKAIANLIQMPADIDVDANYANIVPAEPENIPNPFDTKLSICNSDKNF
jgi:hypothetical protein